jgi:hypothetical protein
MRRLRAGADILEANEQMADRIDEWIAWLKQRSGA